ncbi:MAG: RidA family protein [Armatimonadota bacterium]|nr:RidA family protein [Armatimonadota bacterium]MDR7439355.1 RidA family protein [Armatimonadota bacterium]MDR7563194.1 RidA family protein [Armatimonadota bacterium]MDR7567391.1 RidA family protein [Armatimonadota bacterium]MDR7602830.1 RidA family protein [Armatimonadota bacterium]
MARGRVPANRPWEAVVGYSRAVRVGSLIEVSGTAPVDEHGNVLGGEDYYAQTRAALEIIGRALQELQASFEHVVRTRIYLRDPSRWEEAGRAHQEVFGHIRPATTIVGVGGFVDPRILVEVEATAVVEDP